MLGDSAILKTRAAEHPHPIPVISEVSKHMHLKGRLPHGISVKNVKIFDWDGEWCKRG